MNSKDFFNPSVTIKNLSDINEIDNPYKGLIFCTSDDDNCYYVKKVIKNVDGNILIDEYESISIYEYPGSGSGGGSGSYTEPLADWTTNTTVANLKANTNVTGLTSLELWKKATVSYVNASCSVSYSNNSTILEKGSSFNLTVTAKSFRAGTNNPTKVSLYKDGSKIEELSISSLSSTITFTEISNINTNTKIDVKLTDSNNITTNVGSKSYSFVNPYYYGSNINNILTESDILSLTKKVESKGNKTIDYTTSQSYMVFAYDASYGSINSIIDANGFNVTESFTKQIVNVNGVDYNVYVSNKCIGEYTMQFNY